jgi:hypothetical protein
LQILPERRKNPKRITYESIMNWAKMLLGKNANTFFVNPVRNSSGALNPAGIILKSNPAAAAGPEGLWPGGSSGALFLTG